MIGLLICAWLDIRSKPFRTFAAMSGMFAAIVAVILVDSASELSRAANDEYLARTFGRPVTLSVGVQDLAIAEDSDVDLEHVLQSNGFENVSRNSGYSIEIVSDEQLSMTSGMLVVSPEYPDIQLMHLLYGAWPVDVASSRIAHGAISLEQANVLGFDGRDVVGQVIWYSIREGASGDLLKYARIQPMVIEGIIDPALSAATTPDIIVVSSLAQPSFLPDATSSATNWVARVHPDDVSLFIALVSRYTLPDGTPRYQVNREDLTADLAPTLEQQRVTAQIVSLVALAIGGLGVLGVGIASVRERSRDFGLHRAIGATRPQIFLGVIVQTLIEIVIAAMLGLLVSALFLEVFSRQLVLPSLPLPVSTSLPFSSALTGVVGALVVGLLAGLIPAVSAARTSVVQALRG